MLRRLLLPRLRAHEIAIQYFCAKIHVAMSICSIATRQSTILFHQPYIPLIPPHAYTYSCSCTSIRMGHTVEYAFIIYYYNNAVCSVGGSMLFRSFVRDNRIEKKIWDDLLLCKRHKSPHTYHRRHTDPSLFVGWKNNLENGCFFFA